jgi:hypothetical protein
MFVCRVNPRQLAPTMGIAATGFCYPGGILQVFHQQDQQVLRLPTTASTGSHLADSSRSAHCLHQLVIDKVCYVGGIAKDKTSVMKIKKRRAS